MSKGKRKSDTKNQKAYHDYFIEETYEAGIVLKGTEIKSIRAGRVNLKDSYAGIKTAKCFYTICILVLMSRETGLTMIRREPVNFVSP